MQVNFHYLLKINFEVVNLVRVNPALLNTKCVTNWPHQGFSHSMKVFRFFSLAFKWIRAWCEVSANYAFLMEHSWTT